MSEFARTMTTEELSANIGQEMGVSDWFSLDQKKIDSFAELTQDFNFVHVDAERAKATPFGGTIAHGFLTLALLSWMAYQVCPRLAGAKINLNYGFNRIRFLAPVPAQSRVRGRFTLKAFDRDAKRCQMTYDVQIEIENAPKAAIAAEWLTASVM